ncbi:DUF1571 domain-containing protein [bacterium]|nr:DUF1571 domain-containing protein [bacterium]
MVKKFFISFFLIAMQVSFFRCSNVTAENDLLWDSFKESKDFFEDIQNYVLTVKQDLGVNTLLPKSGTVNNLFEITYLKPGQYYLGFKDNDAGVKEFIYVEGETHRQFIYPKEFKISGDGSFLYNRHVISIKNSSLDFFYRLLIPLCEKERQNIESRFNGISRVGETQVAEFLITFKKPVQIEDMNVKSIQLFLTKENSIPQKISFFNTDNLLLFSLSYEELVFNVDISESFFARKISDKQLDKHMMVKKVFEFEKGMMNDKRKLRDFVSDLSQTALNKYSKITDYSADFIRQERVDGVIGEPEYFFIKFRKPFDLYLRWTKGKRKGWELLYARGRYNNQVVVHVSGLANLLLPTLELNPAGGIAMMNNRHSILEFGIGYLIENYYRDIKDAIEKDEVKLKYLGDKQVDGRLCWVIEAELPKDSKEYYCYKSRLFFDQEYILPIKSVFYEWKDGKEQLIEVYTYKNLSFNNGFTDYDFDRKNKNYDF